MTHHCALCGYTFTDAEMLSVGCPACPSRGKGCGLVRCPACGYEWPGESKSLLAKLFLKLVGGGGR